MSIITIRCRLVAGIKQQIDKKRINNFSEEDRALLQKLLDEKSHTDRDKPKNKEKIFLAQSSEDVRQNLWQLFLISSTLIDELLDRLSQHPNFQTWRQQGNLPDDELKACWLELKTSPLYDEKLPGRFFSSVQKWFGTKRKEARRLEKQLAGHFPRGRDVQDKTLTSCLETINRDDFADDLEYMLWHNPISRNAPPLPHPIEFNSNTDLRWLKLYRKQYKCKRAASGESIELIELTQRLFVEFKGLTRGNNYIFEVYCDRRQLDIFQQFFNDDRLLRNSSSEDKYSSSLFALRSAHLLWDRKESQDRYRHQTLPIQTANEPWNTNQLYLHCSIKTKSLTAEGMREIQQQKTQKVNNILAKQSKNTDPSIDQQQSQRKNQTSLALLNRSLPRHSRPLYQGNPQIIVGLIFAPVRPIYLAVVDVTTGKTPSKIKAISS